jgi:hypothetical protein
MRLANARPILGPGPDFAVSKRGALPCDRPKQVNPRHRAEPFSADPSKRSRIACAQLGSDDQCILEKRLTRQSRFRVEQ